MECFTVYADEIEGRIDPIYLKNKKIIENPQTNYRLVGLGVLLKNKVQYGANEIAKDGDPNTNIRYIRITDVDEYGNLKSDDWRTTEVIEDKYVLNDEDILFARSGATAGKCFIYKKEYGKSIFAGYLIRFVFDKSKINPKYVFYYTQLKRYQLWVKSIQRPSGQPNINAEEFKSFRIPLPSLEVQNKIIKLMDKAYSQKKQKESEAHQLLDSINDYVLDELGIKLPELKESMCFVVNSDNIKQGRIDPNNFLHPQDTANSNKFKEKTLNEVASLVKGQSITKENITSGDYPVIAGGQTSPYTIDKFNHNGDVITVSASGAYSGYVWYHKNHIFASDCTVIKSLDNNVCSTFYLYFVMKVKQRFIYNMQQGAGQPHVYSRELSNLKIPLPTLAVQNKIAEEVKKRMQKAEQLQKEAKEELEKAKQEVEKIILG